MAVSPVVLVVDPAAIWPGGSGIDFTLLSSFVDAVAAQQRETPTVAVVGGAAASSDLAIAGLKYASKQRRAHVAALLGTSQVQSFCSSRCRDLGVTVAEVQITRASFADRRTYFSVRDVLYTLAANTIVPLVAPNHILEGTTPSLEPKCGSMELGALIAGMLNASAMVVLGRKSHVVLREKGKKGTKRLGDVEFPSVEASTRSGTEIPKNPAGPHWFDLRAAARLLHTLGIPLHYGDTSGSEPVSELLNFARDHTMFVPRKAPSFDGVKRWLCTGAVPRGTLVVSPLGAKVLRKDKSRGSLLAAGIVRSEGMFDQNDVVGICDEQGRLLGYGVSRYSSTDVPGLRGRENVVIVHADYLFCTAQGLFPD